MKHVPLTAALFLTAAAIAFPPADEKDPAWRAVLPARELTPLAEQIARALKKPVEGLAGGKLDDDDRERAVKKARGLTLMLLAGAQSTGNDADRRGAVRNAAAELDRALRAGKFADAKAMLAVLTDGKGREKPPFAVAPLADADGRDDAIAALMQQFRTRLLGGLGVEPAPKDPMLDGMDAMLKQLGKTGDGLKPDETARFAYHLAVLAEATRSLPPKPRADKDPAKWLKWSADMRVASLELATAAQMKDRAAIKQAALRVGKSCGDCHRLFRDN